MSKGRRCLIDSLTGSSTSAQPPSIPGMSTVPRHVRQIHQPFLSLTISPSLREPGASPGVARRQQPPPEDPVMDMRLAHSTLSRRYNARTWAVRVVDRR